MVKNALWMLLLILVCRSAYAAWSSSDSEQLLAKMEASYDEVQDYHTRLVITGFGRDDSFRSRQELIYRFKKPNKVRIDFITPHSGMTILYPASEGKVLVQPSGWASLFALNLDVSHSLLEISPGQRIDQTDYGVLIANIRHSLTDLFLGDLRVDVTPEQTILHVQSDNPFQRGTATRYVFAIDNRLSLPVRVTEMDAHGRLLRTVDYRDLKINTGLSEALFILPKPHED
jgi:outer membrane lipoprotein-sorting protein